MELDLAGVRCPMNYAKVTLMLETLEDGDELDVLLDVGEPVRNVPASLRMDGHEILGLEQVGRTEQFRMTVRKKGRGTERGP